MKLEHAKEVKYAYTEEEVNQALKDGFEIHRTYSLKFKYPETEYTQVLTYMVKHGHENPAVPQETRANKRKKGIIIIENAGK